MADDPIARILADAYLAKYAKPAQETADEWLARETAAQRERTLARVLAALRRGCEPPETDIAMLRPDAEKHLAYLDARDDALALYGGELSWAYARAREAEALAEAEALE